MSSLLSAVTGTTDQTKSNDSIDHAQKSKRRDSSESGGSRRRTLALAAAGLGVAYVLRRRLSGGQSSERQASTAPTTGELDASTSTKEKQGGRFGGRLTRMIAGIAASVLVRRAIRRWRKR